ncbi:hypothetical protein TKK_0015801 [Trichogramma kaykai]
MTIIDTLLTFTGDINVNVKIPREAEINKSVNLDCTWWLSSNNSSLYSVKWYKDEYEFYSYMPENDPDSRIKTHPVNGVNVDPCEQPNDRLANLDKNGIKDKGSSRKFIEAKY